jgi:Fe-S oxidoreductase
MLNLRNRVPALAALGERLTGFSSKRPLPKWHDRPFRNAEAAADGAAAEVVLFVDTFNRWFEADNARAALTVLEAAGYKVHVANPPKGERPLCCGRTFLSAGLVDEARAEQRRVLDALGPYVERGIPIVGLEPSCLLTMRDEFKSVLPGEASTALAGRAVLLEEFLAAEAEAGRLRLKLKALPQAGAAARALPPEGFRRAGPDGTDAEDDPRTGGLDHPVHLLRHGRGLRLSGGTLRDVDEDG